MQKMHCGRSDCKVYTMITRVAQVKANENEMLRLMVVKYCRFYSVVKWGCLQRPASLYSRVAILSRLETLADSGWAIAARRSKVQARWAPPILYLCECAELQKKKNHQKSSTRRDMQHHTSSCAPFFHLTISKELSSIVHRDK